MTDAVVLPDVEAIVAAYLREHAAIAALGAGVGTRIPDEPTWPFLRLTRSGGRPVTQRPLWLAAPRLEVESWADLTDDGKAVAWELGATAVGALAGMAGSFDGGVVTGVEITTDLQWLPDPQTNRPRYLFFALVFCHPTPASAGV